MTKKIGWWGCVVSLGALLGTTEVTSDVFGRAGETIAARKGGGSNAREGTGVNDADSVSLQGPFVPTDADSAEESQRPHLCLGPDLALYLTYQTERSPIGSRLLLTRSVDGGFHWPNRYTVIDDWPYVTISDGTTVIRSDAGGTAWIVRDPSLVQKVRFTRLDSRGDVVAASVRVDDDSPNEGRSVPLLLYTEGVWVCAWWQTSPEGQSWAVVARSFDDGHTWRRPNEVVDSVLYRDPLAGPEIAASANGDIYAVLYRWDQERRLYRTRASSSEWEQVTVPHVPEFWEEAYSSVAVSPDGTVGLVFCLLLPDPPVISVWFSTSADRGESWTEPVQISDPAIPRNNYSPHLSCDGHGGWHAVWVQNTPSVSDLDAFYCFRAPGQGSWTPPVRVNPEVGEVHASMPRSVAIVTDAEGYAYIAYEYAAGTPFNSRAIHIMTTPPRPYDPWEGTNWHLSTVTPNPSSSPVTLRFPSPFPGTALVRLFDVRGRLVREWPDLEVPRGVHPLGWDGRAASGERASAGVYFWEVSVAGSEGTTRTRARSVLLSR
jgi:hypothetical protein